VSALNAGACDGVGAVQKRAQRDRAAGASAWSEAEYIRDAMAQQLLERMSEAKNDMPTLVELNAGAGSLFHHWRGQGGVQTWIQVDSSAVALGRGVERSRPREVSATGLSTKYLVNPAVAATPPDGGDDDDLQDLFDAGFTTAPVSPSGSSQSTVDVIRVCGDEEYLPIQPQCADAVVSVLGLHWTNDIESTLKYARSVLKPDGLFLCVLFGGESVHELRTSLIAAETERRGGVSPRCSPLIRESDAAALLSASGFALPGVDTSFVQVEFSSPFAAMEALQEMGESGAPVTGQGPSLGAGQGRDVLLSAAALWQWRFGGMMVDGQGDEDLRTRFGEARSRPPVDSCEATDRVQATVPLTFQLVWLAAFAPSAAQPRPLPRGSVPHGFKKKPERKDPDGPTDLEDLFLSSPSSRS
jgi:SAM-dependent methyltransferase